MQEFLPISSKPPIIWNMISIRHKYTLSFFEASLKRRKVVRQSIVFLGKLEVTRFKELHRCGRYPGNVCIWPQSALAGLQVRSIAWMWCNSHFRDFHLGKGTSFEMQLMLFCLSLLLIELVNSCLDFLQFCNCVFHQLSEPRAVFPHPLLTCAFYHHFFNADLL